MNKLELDSLVNIFQKLATKLPDFNIKSLIVASVWPSGQLPATICQDIEGIFLRNAIPFISLISFWLYVRAVERIPSPSNG